MEKILVVVLAMALVAGIVWWFFGKHKTSESKAEVAGDKQSVEVVVNGGYTPNVVTLKHDVPAEIVFDRKDPSGCFNEVVFPDFGIHETLPTNQKHPVSIDTSKPGEYTYACGMNMFHGKVVIK